MHCCNLLRLFSSEDLPKMVKKERREQSRSIDRFDVNVNIDSFSAIHMRTAACLPTDYLILRKLHPKLVEKSKRFVMFSYPSFFYASTKCNNLWSNRNKLERTFEIRFISLLSFRSLTAQINVHKYGKSKQKIETARMKDREMK